jgi:hypothetical protein
MATKVERLQELVAALDRRVRRPERAGEAVIAKDSADLRRDALREIAEEGGGGAPATHAETSATDCQLCLTPGPSLTDDATTGTVSWRCRRCDHVWSRERLAVVAAYGRYCVARASL